MSAQLIVAGGPLAGNHYELNATEVSIGRAPTATVALPEAEAAWRHCVVRAQAGDHWLVDLHTSSGTYVNGLRVSSQRLEDGDQIAIGGTTFLFRKLGTATSERKDSARVTLLRACTLLFLFRGLGTNTPAVHAALLESHVVSLLGELAPCERATVLICANEEELRSEALEREAEHPGLSVQVSRVLTDGPSINREARLVGVPVYAAGLPRGVIVARFAEEYAPFLDEQLEVLSAVSTLASVALETVHEVETLKNENAALQEKLTADEFGIVGKSAAMRRLLGIAQRVAAQDTTVLVLGESGTGKELIARALHTASPRQKKPFVAINCAALTETLLESELFGHEKGAFTGAIAQKKGKLEVAEGGTVFLDEIGEMASTLQAKLLRVIQEREFERVGGTKTLRLDVRLVAATNRDLLARVKAGAFREDLYHRLNVVALQMPPLRDRPEDIPLLAEHFLRKSARRAGRAMAGITPEAEHALLAYAWPGNVRELENAMERGVVLSDSEWLTAADLPDAIAQVALEAQSGTKYDAAIGDAKRDAVVRAWEQSGGDYRRAAELLGIHPNSLLRLIRKHGLRDLLGRGASA